MKHKRRAPQPPAHRDPNDRGARPITVPLEHWDHVTRYRTPIAPSALELEINEKIDRMAENL